MMVRIDELSTEILAIIAEYLESDDLFTFRLIIRRFATCSRPVFIKRYFRQRVHLLPRDSLVTLLDISRNLNLGRLI